MAVHDAMFVFEIVVQSFQSYVESRAMMIKSEFADIFSLELKDPKLLHIVMPEPPPPPPEPPGKKKGKKKKAKKAKKKKKKGKEPPPPPEPVIQAGQSVLFATSPDVLLQSMVDCPLQLSLWSKEDNLSFIGSNAIVWDNQFLKYLEEIIKCKRPPPVIVNDEYNVFLEDNGQLMAKIGLQIQLFYLGEKITTAFRSLSEDTSIRKFLYTGINSKNTSFMCTLKTTEEDYLAFSSRLDSSYTKDIKKSKEPVFADYKNAPGANLSMFQEGDYCCMSGADKPPESVYSSPDTLPDIDFICDYIRKVMLSCNDNMRMLTPQPTIRPIARATDIDRLCYCRETQWPSGELAQRFKKEVQGPPCPVCSEKKDEGLATSFNLANIRGPCGRVDCKIARNMRVYIENLALEDQTEVDINEIVGPCGSKVCDLAVKIKELLRHEGVFNTSHNVGGLSTQCACLQQMQEALTIKGTCTADCDKDCEYAESDDQCGGPGCPFSEPGPSHPPVYHVYYFTIEYDCEKDKPVDPSKTISGKSSKSPSEKSSKASSGTSSPVKSSSKVGKPSGTSSATGSESSLSKSTKSGANDANVDPNETQLAKMGLKYCSKECPGLDNIGRIPCSQSVCNIFLPKKKLASEVCPKVPCPREGQYTPSPADSNIVINLDDIRNPCCVADCDVAHTVKDFIVDGLESRKKRAEDPDGCYCDCVCTFKFSKQTTYCGMCGGYEVLGDDVRNLPDYAKPHPCPVYHKLYDQNIIKVPNPWPEVPAPEAFSVKASKTISRNASIRRVNASVTRSSKKSDDKKSSHRESSAKNRPAPAKKKPQSKKSPKTVAEGAASPAPAVKKPDPKYPYPQVPKHMGWNWAADDIPGLKPRPKWRPGAASKILVRRYRALREGENTIAAKKKRALLQRKKKVELKPTLTVTKREGGEYTVQMEVFKKFSKERLIFQYPYEEKPPVIYTIGKTAEEKRKLQKQRERKERRESRRKNRLLQSTFRDKCQEICVKAYNQAIGVLPVPNPNDPACPCEMNEDAMGMSPIVDSCSCSESGTISSSDTDGDTWTIEFSPPMARWDPKVRHAPASADVETQYTYLDYKVRLLDKHGHQVPRCFRGPDGRQECSDLGGFWGPNHVWMEINKDGYIGVDGRWVPINFIGPDGMNYSAEDGFFTDSSGKTLRIGIDGYIDNDNKWAWYGKRPPPMKGKADVGKFGDKGKRGPSPPAKPGEKPGDKQKPSDKGKPGILSKVEKSPPAKAPAKGVIAEKPKKTLTYGPKTGTKPVVMSASTNFAISRFNRTPDSQLKPAQRSRAGDAKKFARYHEILRSLQKYADIGELRPPIKSNRASNTLRKRVSPFTIYGGYRAMPCEPNTACSTISQSQSGSCLNRPQLDVCFN